MIHEEWQGDIEKSFHGGYLGNLKIHLPFENTMKCQSDESSHKKAP